MERSPDTDLRLRRPTRPRLYWRGCVQRADRARAQERRALRISSVGARDRGPAFWHPALVRVVDRPRHGISIASRDAHRYFS